MTLPDALTFLALTGIFEPSAIQQLPDGRFLVVEDEKQRPFSLVTLAADGALASTPLILGEEAGKLDDLEGLTLDAAGRVLAITSHSRDKDGDEKKSREKLVRFRVEGDRAVELDVVGGLKAALAAAHPLLAAAALVRDVKGAGGLNIEGLEMAPDQRLLVGLRGPLHEGRAIVAVVENPAAVFDADEPPRIGAALHLLDLGGHGIRALSHVPALGGYLIVSGPVSREPSAFRLWWWSGAADTPARPVTVSGLAGLEHAEGIAPARVGDRPGLIVVSDDGSRAEGRPARYLLFDPARLTLP